jgi:hypothetical protein
VLKLAKERGHTRHARFAEKKPTKTVKHSIDQKVGSSFVENHAKQNGEIQRCSAEKNIAIGKAGHP